MVSTVPTPSREISVSLEFKKQASKAIFAIVVFMVTYLILLAFAIILTILCFIGGVLLIINIPRIITIILGIGLASLGVFVLVFLIKFTFKSHKTDRSHLLEITRNEQPNLFQLIDTIVEKVGTKAPKHVYLAAEVNAYVFYDSSFLSMFMPIQKNLVIGFGLVNSVSQEELTSILAHEFGHFSQKSMKLGSYAHNVNQVIINMLYDNTNYNSALQSWTNASAYMYVFGVVAKVIIQIIQEVLGLLFKFVNSTHLALSREMEFHADAVAASVTGYEPLVRVLPRIEFAETAYNQVLHFYSHSYNNYSVNFYADHAFLLTYLAAYENIPIKNNLPQVSTADLEKYNKSKLEIENEWASHPSTELRIKMLKKIGFFASHSTDVPAMRLFVNAEQLQKRLSKYIFTTQGISLEAKQIPIEDFENAFSQDFMQNQSPKLFNGYYDGNDFTAIDWQNVVFSGVDTSFESLYSAEKVDWVLQANALNQDIETLKQIASNTTEIKKFRYDQQSYESQDAPNLITKLEAEASQLAEKIQQNNLLIYQYFVQLEQKVRFEARLEELYKNYLVFEAYFKSEIEKIDSMFSLLNFLHQTTPFHTIKSNFIKLEPVEERFKQRVKAVLNDNEYQAILTEETRVVLEKYVSKTWIYFLEDNYIPENINTLFSAITQYPQVLGLKLSSLKQAILLYQEELERKVNHA